MSQIQDVCYKSLTEIPYEEVNMLYKVKLERKNKKLDKYFSSMNFCRKKNKKISLILIC